MVTCTSLLFPLHLLHVDRSIFTEFEAIFIVGGMAWSITVIVHSDRLINRGMEEGMG